MKTAKQDPSNSDGPDSVAGSSRPGHVRGTDSYSTSSPIGDAERQRMDGQAWLHVEAQLRWALHFWVNR